MEQQAHRFFGVDSSRMRTPGKKGGEWSLKDWKWDGDLFIATPLDPVTCSAFQDSRKFIPVSATGHSSNSASSCSDEVLQRRELDRKKRTANYHDDSLEDEAGTLTLNLGGGRYPVSVSSDAHTASTLDAVSGKKAKLAGASASRAVCQVENCGSDLSTAKDYHRRHKVCEMHSKATKALVSNVMQRFCQQCSRFHVLHEFDEGKRSCRRRLAGHNKRRRKTQPEMVTSAHSVTDEQTSSYLLVSLLRLLSNVHGGNKSDLMTEQDLVAHLLGTLANRSGSPEVNDISGLLHESHKLLNGQLTVGNAEKISNFLSNISARPPGPVNQHLQMSISETPQEGVLDVARDGSPQMASPEKHNRMLANERLLVCSEIREDPAGRTKLNNFDLNDMYVDSDDGTEDVERSPITGNFHTGSVDCPSWVQHDSQQSSPPQISGNSDSASAQSPSSSSGEAQSRTDRIVFKLFGKEPNDFPLMLRAQILDWLAHSPTEMESYIRPGCVILTIYVRLAEAIWDEVYSDLGSCLSRLLDMHDDVFWRSGWLFMRWQNQVAFVRDGQMVVRSLLPVHTSYCSSIVSVTPIAVATSGEAQFDIRGSNICRSTTRLLCALEGQYLVLEACQDQESYAAADISIDKDETECVRFSCSIPSVIGRGFIEVEDDGMSGSFFPFIVAEKDVCSEIRTLESVLCFPEASDDATVGNIDSKHEAMGFMHEMGWLLHRCGLKSRLDDPEHLNNDAFSFKRFTWLMEFSIDHDWSAVVKKLLDILFEGMVDMEEHCSLEAALSGMGLLHKAVRRNSRTLVELLLGYSAPVKEGGYEYKCNTKYLFKPDAKGPASLTPLHLAAGRDGSEDILDALTDDPGKVGIGAWKNAHDSTGSSPEDYARLRGHYAYIHLVQKKINKRPPSSSGSVTVDIPDEVLSEISGSSKQSAGIRAAPSLEIVGGGRALNMRSCKFCCEKKQTSYASIGTRSSLVYRPAMLSMVAIAAVCVCVALLFKSLPEVVYVFRPFRWEMLDYGSI